MQRTPRLACLEDGDTALLARLLAEGGWDLSQPLVSKPDRLPLHIAASSGRLECVRMLLAAGADPRQMSSDGMDALACAVTEGHAHLIRPLLEAGSAGIQEPRNQLTPETRQQMGVPDLLPEDQCMGQTLLALAAAKDAVQCLEVLLDLGADINQPSPGNGTRPAQAAALRGAAKALAFLADRGANLAAKDKMGLTVLHYCCGHGAAISRDVPMCLADSCPHAQCLQALFSRNYCLGLLESTTGQGFTPLGTACYHGHVAPARVLLAQGAAVDGADPATAGPLVAACSAGCPELVELLLDSGARYPAAPLPDGKSSPLQAALFEQMQSDAAPWGKSTPGHLRCAEVLLERGLCSDEDKSIMLWLDVRFGAVDSGAEATRLLLRHGAPPNQSGIPGLAPTGGPVPIYFAAKRGYTAAVEALLQHGALLLPPRRSDNALIFAAAQPSACTLILHASRSLEQAQRRRLYSTLVPPNLPLPEAITQPPGKPTWKAVLDACDDRKCAKLLRACLREVGMEVEMELPPRPPPEQPSMEQQFPGLARMAQSGGAPGSSSAGTASSNSRAGGGSTGMPSTAGDGSPMGITHFITDPNDRDQVSRQMDAQFERRHREVPEMVYGIIFDANWRSLSQPKLLAEVRRVLQPLRSCSAAGAEDLQYLFIFLSNAVYSSRLRGVLMKEDLPGLLAGVLTPEAAQQQPLAWHQPAASMLNSLLNVEARKVGKHGPALARYLWALLHRFFPGPRTARVAESEEPEAFTYLCIAQCLMNLAGPGGVAQLFALCPGGEDMGRMLVLRACAAAMAKQDDQTPVVSVIKVLKELRVFGVHDMAVPPSKCLLYRSVDARELFTQPCLLGTSLQCIKGLALELQQAPLAASFLQDLMPLLACCTVEARHLGLVRLVIDGINSPAVELANGFICVLYLLVHYADKETVNCFARAGLLPAIEARIAQLLAGGTSAAALTAAVAAQTSHNNSVLANTLAMCVAVAARRTDEMAGEAINCKAVAKAANLISAIALAFGEQPQQSIWSALGRQMGFLLVVFCDHAAVARKAVAELGLHNILAEVLPRVHLSVVPNLLGVWAKLLQHAGDRIAADMRAQGVLTARSFQGSTQPMMVVMACLERFAAQPQLAHIAGGVLAVTLRVIEGEPNPAHFQLGGGGPHPIFGKQRFHGQDPPPPEGGVCACCGVAAGTPGIALKKCSRCRSVAYCTTVCQTRHWRHWHKAACHAPA